MKTSVLVIAHNEEQFIGKCVRSLLKQSRMPDEIVVIVHNSTDRTLEIATQYPITTVSFSGPPGLVQSRIEGLKHVTRDVVLCIDGDSYAQDNWVEVMSHTLQNGNILVGSWVKFKGNLFASITSRLNRYFCDLKGEEASTWIWGPSFAFWKRDGPTVEQIWRDSIELSTRARLSRNPEDYWLALFMSKRGRLEVTNKTSVTNYVKEKTLLQGMKRHRDNVRNGIAARNFFKSIPSGCH